ncbi:MAG: HPr family phosphocarrier protein [Micrococcales bacterium]|jgi:phosphocarrier protein HPr|nr:HPr family phosphocarrier protein [Microbacteriaceae bacterium]NBR22213.1 HPr family phosphocarrier protein [Micrococcales bacterium]NBX94993.1 HPr family phosphocarrier protein [Actinomycetota bacterium]NBR77371.1 HPr family phosphocarrier protein [Microbacteriaceae bacterium]NBS60450.1 HPr family phosphocarrier protein [Microbacteriaceae bacterium]
MAKAVVKVMTEVGLHARPAAEFVKAVAASGHLVHITNRTGKKVLGNSILGILSLGIKHGEEITIEVSGLSEEAVLESLIAVVSGL